MTILFLGNSHVSAFKLATASLPPPSANPLFIVLEAEILPMYHWWMVVSEQAPQGLYSVKNL